MIRKPIMGRKSIYGIGRVSKADLNELINSHKEDELALASDIKVGDLVQLNPEAIKVISNFYYDKSVLLSKKYIITNVLSVNDMLVYRLKDSDTDVVELFLVPRSFITKVDSVKSMDVDNKFYVLKEETICRSEDRNSVFKIILCGLSSCKVYDITKNENHKFWIGLNSLEEVKPQFSIGEKVYVKQHRHTPQVLTPVTIESVRIEYDRSISYRLSPLNAWCSEVNLYRIKITEASYIDESKKIDVNISCFNTIRNIFANAEKDNNSTPTSMDINNVSCNCLGCLFEKEISASGVKESRKEKDSPKSYTNKTNPNSLIDSITEKMKDPDLTLKQKEELFGMRTIMEFLTGMSNSNDSVKPTKSFIPSKIAEEFTSKYPYPMHYEIISGKKASSVVRVIDENRKSIWLAIYKTDNITHDINSVYKKDTESYKKLTRAVALGKFLLDKLLEVVQEPNPNLTYLLKDMNFDAPVSSRLHYLASDKIIAIPIYIG